MQTLFQVQQALQGAPDQFLAAEMQKPSGRYPAALVYSEIQRRRDMRDASSSVETTPIIPGMRSGGNPSSTLNKKYSGYTADELLRMIDNGTVPSQDLDYVFGLLKQSKDKYTPGVTPSERKQQDAILQQAEDPNADINSLYNKFSANGNQPNPTPQGNSPAAGYSGYRPEDSLFQALAKKSTPQVVAEQAPGGGAGVPPPPAFHLSKIPDRTVGLQAAGDAAMKGIAAQYDTLGKPVSLPDSYSDLIADRQKRLNQPTKWGQAGLAVAAGLLGTPGMARGLSAGIQMAQPYISQLDQQKREDRNYIDQLQLAKRQEGREDQRYNLGRADMATQGRLQHAMDPYNLRRDIAGLQTSQDAAQADRDYKQQYLGLQQQELEIKRPYYAALGQRPNMRMNQIALQGVIRSAQDFLKNTDMKDEATMQSEWAQRYPGVSYGDIAGLTSLVNGASADPAGAIDASSYF